jgi:hypothetical protein
VINDCSQPIVCSIPSHNRPQQYKNNKEEKEKEREREKRGEQGVEGGKGDRGRTCHELCCPWSVELELRHVSSGGFVATNNSHDTNSYMKYVMKYMHMQ